jgi:hypothetical protein
MRQRRRPAQHEPAARLIAEQHATPKGRRGRIELANDGGARFSLVLP